jgi:uncharacterized protein (TIGR02996 family)
VSLALAHAALADGREAEALAHLLGAWRASRAPRIGALVEELGRRAAHGAPPLSPQRHAEWLAVGRARRPEDFDRLAASVVAKKASEARERVELLCAGPDDPRLATLLVRLLSEATFNSRYTNRAILSRLPSLRDATLRPRLEPLPAQLVAFGEDRDWLRAQLALVLPSLPTIAPAPLSRDDQAACDELEARLARGRDDQQAGAALLAAVYARPADDAPRLVYADWLQERGDPRGEFIALQFQRLRGVLDGDGEKRERALLRQHLRAWLGANLSKVVSPQKGLRFERGFPVAIRLADQHNRGISHRAIADDVGFTTVEEIEIVEYFYDPTLLLGRHLTSLRAVTNANSTLLGQIAAVGRPLAIERLGLDRYPDLSQLGRALAHLPRLRVIESPTVTMALEVFARAHRLELRALAR